MKWLFIIKMKQVIIMQSRLGIQITKTVDHH